MKSILLAAAAVLFVAAPAVAQQALSGPPTILVTGSGEAEAQPDQFTISLSVVGRGVTQIEALQSMAAIQNRVMETLPALEGLTRSGITTGNTALETVYDPACNTDDYRGDPEDCPVVGYSVTSPLTFQGSPAERAGDALSLAAELGARNARLNSYSVTDRRSVQDAANRAAFLDAERQARMLSEAAGRRIVGILRIQDPSARLIGNSEGENALEDVVVTARSRESPTVSIAVRPEPVRTTSRVTVAFQIE